MMVSDLIERLRGYPGMSMEKLMETTYGKSYAGLAVEAATKITGLLARIERLEAIEKAAFLAGWDHYSMSRCRMDMPRDRIGCYRFWKAKQQENDGE